MNTEKILDTLNEAKQENNSFWSGEINIVMHPSDFADLVCESELNEIYNNTIHHDHTIHYDHIGKHYVCGLLIEQSMNVGIGQWYLEAKDGTKHHQNKNE